MGDKKLPSYKEYMESKGDEQGLEDADWIPGGWSPTDIIKKGMKKAMSMGVKTFGKSKMAKDIAKKVPKKSTEKAHEEIAKARMKEAADRKAKIKESEDNANTVDYSKMEKTPDTRDPWRKKLDIEKERKKNLMVK